VHPIHPYPQVEYVQARIRDEWRPLKDYSIELHGLKVKRSGKYDKNQGCITRRRA
jgi:hypothetical protein